MNQRTRKLMKVHKALRQRDDIDKLHMYRKEGERGRVSFENSVDTSIRRFEYFIKKSKERIVSVTRNSRDYIKTNRTTIPSKQKLEEKQLYGYFKRQTQEILYENTWIWLRKGNLK